MLSSKQKIKYLQNELNQVLNSWSNPPNAPYNDLKKITENDYDTVCDFKEALKYIIDKYSYFEYVNKDTDTLDSGEYYFNPETQLLYVKDNPSEHDFKAYKSTGSYMVNDNTPETQFDQYMTTRKDYNSDVYDILVNYNQLPTNLNKPKDNDVKNIFEKSMPLTKKAIIDIIINYNTENHGAYTDYVLYKVGTTVINSSIIFHEYSIYCETLELTDDGDLNQIDGDNLYYNVLLDNKGDLYIQENNDTGRINGTLTFNDETGDITIEG